MIQVRSLIASEADPATRLQIVSVMKRTYQLEPMGLEIFFSGRNSLYLTFKSYDQRERYPWLKRSGAKYRDLEAHNAHQQGFTACVCRVDRLLRDQPVVRLQSQRSPQRWERTALRWSLYRRIL